MSAVVGAVPLSLSGLASKPLICPLPLLLPGEWSEWVREDEEREKFWTESGVDDEANFEVMRGC